MVELRRTTRDAVGPDGIPVVGRGYDVCDDEGRPLTREQLAPGAFEGIAIVSVTPTSAEERIVLGTAPFGVGRAVTLRADEHGVALLDKGGTARAGRVDDAVAAGTRELLQRSEGLTAWVCWEWLSEDGRSGVEVAVSTEELMPQRMGPPPQVSTARALLLDKRVWFALAAVVVVVLVVLAVVT